MFRLKRLFAEDGFLAWLLWAVRSPLDAGKVEGRRAPRQRRHLDADGNDSEPPDPRLKGR